MTSPLPTLYSFRRCPYAMRARMALIASGAQVLLREVVLRDKPEEMIIVSPKATVPVLVVSEDDVVDESLAIMRWALAENDPEDWLTDQAAAEHLIQETEDVFKYHLDRYKYPSRYDGVDPLEHRAAGLEFLTKLDLQLSENGQLFGYKPGLADIAIFPFVRQFANNDRIWFDAQPVPALQKWLADHLQSALFTSIMTKYPQWKAGDLEPVFGQQVH